MCPSSPRLLWPPGHQGLLLLTLFLGLVLALEPDPSFAPSPSPPLARFVYSPATDSIFAAGTNVILELDASSLRLLGRMETGPRLDSPSCHASGCSDAHNATRRMTDNVNKVLVLDGQSQHLVACGSLFQGACQKIAVRGHLQVGRFR